jgi:hypothetical protein
MRLAAPVALAALVAAAAPASAVIIQGTELPQYTPVTNQLALSHGATFSSTMPFVTFGTNGVNTVGIYGTDPSFPPLASYAAYYAPIEITFVSMVDGVTPAVVNGTVNGVFGDGGGDLDGIRIRAFDVSNNLLATSYGLGNTWTPISITATGIRTLIFDQSGFGAGTSDTFLDWIDYSAPVPVPAPGAGAAAVMGAVLAMGRRRRV